MFEDRALGRCEDYDPLTDRFSSDYIYQLDRKTFLLLEQELTRLALLGFDWPDSYTQCILKTILNDRPRTYFDRSVCDHLLQIDSSIDFAQRNLVNELFPVEQNDEFDSKFFRNLLKDSLLTNDIDNDVDVDEHDDDDDEIKAREAFEALNKQKKSRHIGFRNDLNKESLPSIPLFPSTSSAISSSPKQSQALANNSLESSSSSINTNHSNSINVSSSNQTDPIAIEQNRNDLNDVQERLLKTEKELGRYLRYLIENNRAKPNRNRFSLVESIPYLYVDYDDGTNDLFHNTEADDEDGKEDDGDEESHNGNIESILDEKYQPLSNDKELLQFYRLYRNHRPTIDSDPKNIKNNQFKNEDFVAPHNNDRLASNRFWIKSLGNNNDNFGSSGSIKERDPIDYEWIESPNDDNFIVVDYDPNEDEDNFFNLDGDKNNRFEHFPTNRFTSIDLDDEIDDDVSDNDGFIFNAKSNDDDNKDVIERNNTPILENDLDDDEDEDGENEKEILLDEINYSNNYLIPNFYRNHRFDIKKPGPIYLDELLLEENDGQKQSPSLDLDRNIGVENRPVQHFKDSDDSKRNKKFNSFHSDQG